MFFNHRRKRLLSKILISSLQRDVYAKTDIIIALIKRINLQKKKNKNEFADEDNSFAAIRIC